MRRSRLNFQQFSCLLAETTTEGLNGASDLKSRHRRGGKAVTFRGVDNSTSPTRLRASLRRLVADGGEARGKATVRFRDELREALQATHAARGGKGQDRVDRETVRRAMKGCGAPLDGETLGDLERHLDRDGTGDMRVVVRDTDGSNDP